MSGLRAALRAIAADVIVTEPGRARLSSGEEFEFGVAGTPSAGLSELLYGRHYCRPGQPVHGAIGRDDLFLAALRSANPVASRVGAAREMVTAGHYFAIGRAVAEAATGRQVRFYWNVAPDGAAPLLTMLATGLERRRIPFQLKVPIAAGGYGRADAGVLYCTGEDVAAAIDLIHVAHAALLPVLRDDAPLFVRRLAPGLGFAESPPSGESFGMQRCRLLAEGLIAARTKACAPEEAMMARLVDYGLHPDRLERNPATAFPYLFDSFDA